jgi:hypothetical protein
MFATVIEGCGSVFVVIDALDECSPDTRQELIQTLRSVDPGIQLLITSRYLSDIKEKLGDVSKLDVFAPEEDLKSYAQGCIERYSVSQTQLGTLSDEAREEYLCKIAQSAAGMFVLLLPPKQFHLLIPKGFPWFNFWFNSGRTLDDLELGFRHFHISPKRLIHSTVRSWREYLIKQVRMQL